MIDLSIFYNKTNKELYELCLNKNIKYWVYDYWISEKEFVKGIDGFNYNKNRIRNKGEEEKLITKCVTNNQFLMKIFTSNTIDITLNQLMLLKLVNAQNFNEDMISTYKQLIRESVDIEKNIIYGKNINYSLILSNDFVEDIAFLFDDNEELLFIIKLIVS